MWWPFEYETTLHMLREGSSHQVAISVFQNVCVVQSDLLRVVVLLLPAEDPRCIHRKVSSMGFDLTTKQSAEFLTEQLATNGATPTITSSKVRAQAMAGLFTPLATSKQVRLDSDELLTFARRTRYVQDPKEIDSTIFRVSVLARKQRTARIFERDTHNPLSDFMGVDYTNPHELEGVECIWEVSDSNCDVMVATGCTLLATCKGYVHPEHVRIVTGWGRIEGSKSKYFRTGPASDRVKTVVGTGLWIDVPPGRKSDFLVKRDW